MIFFNQDPLSQYPTPVFPSGIPNASEASAIHSHLEEVIAELRKLDVTLATILATRLHVINRIQRCRGALAPYKMLPTELVREIIRLCVPEQAWFPLKEGQNDPHLQITQICSAWRDIAFSIPTLWDMRFNQGYLLASFVQLAKAWLDQVSASGYLIATHNNMPTVQPDTFHGPDAVFKELIAPNSRRLGALHLTLDGLQWDVIRSLPFDNLATLTLDSYFLSIPGEVGGLLSAPSLRSVSIYADYMSPGMESPPSLPWAQLLHLTITGSHPVHSVLSMLVQSTLLEVCRFHPAVHTSPPPSAIYLPYLKSLSLITVFPTSLNFLPLFKLPRLSTLILQTLPASGPTILIDFIHSVEKTLCRFEIGIRTGEIFVDETIITAISTVTYVGFLKDHRLSPSTVLQISSGVMLPNIEHLEFGISDKDNVQSVVDMLSARSTCDPTRTISCIREVVVHCDNFSWEDQVKSQLQNLRSQGMVITSQIS